MNELVNILWKDLLIEWRSRSRTLALLSFAYTILLLFSFAIGPDASVLKQHAGAYLWLGLLLSSTLLLERSMRIEFETGAMAKLILLPIRPSSVFYGKAIANSAQLWLVGAFSVPLVFIVCDAALTESAFWLALTLVLGSAGLSAPGTLYAAMLARLSGKQLLLPLMLFPLVVPVVVAAVKATSLAMLGDPMNQIGAWLTLLACFNLVYWSLCGALFRRVVEA